MPISLLTLKPTSDRKVEADDSAAAVMPASISAPSASGSIVSDAQTIAPSGGSMPGSRRLMIAPMPYTMTCSRPMITAAMIAARSTTCSFRAIR